MADSRKAASYKPQHTKNPSHSTHQHFPWGGRRAAGWEKEGLVCDPNPTISPFSKHQMIAAT